MLMNQSELQQLLSSQTQDSGSLIEGILEPLVPMLTILLTIGALLTILIVILFIVSIVQKQRQHKAIMRIDKNLQLLVDTKITSQQQVSSSSALDSSD